MTAHPILDDIFHGCALTAFVEEAQKAGDWPDSRAVKRKAYELYEEELARNNGPSNSSRIGKGCEP